MYEDLMWQQIARQGYTGGLGGPTSPQGLMGRILPQQILPGNVQGPPAPGMQYPQANGTMMNVPQGLMNFSGGGGGGGAPQQPPMMSMGQIPASPAGSTVNEYTGGKSLGMGPWGAAIGAAVGTLLGISNYI